MGFPLELTLIHILRFVPFVTFFTFIKQDMLKFCICIFDVFMSKSQKAPIDFDFLSWDIGSIHLRSKIEFSWAIQNQLLLSKDFQQLLRKLHKTKHSFLSLGRRNSRRFNGLQSFERLKELER